VIILLLFLGGSAWTAEFEISFKEAAFEKTEGFTRAPYRNDKDIYIGSDSGITSRNVIKLEMVETHGEHVLAISLDADGGRLNSIFTAKHLGKRIAITINGTVISAPLVLATSDEHVWIGGASPKDIEAAIASFSNR
jgi:preprotein translocase subunit SecD